SELSGKLANVVIGALLTSLTHVVGKQVAGYGVGLVAAVIIAVWPNLVFHTGILSSDLLAATGFIGAVWLAMRKGRTALQSGAVGLVIGWMILDRTQLPRLRRADRDRHQWRLQLLANEPSIRRWQTIHSGLLCRWIAKAIATNSSTFASITALTDDASDETFLAI